MRVSILPLALLLAALAAACSDSPSAPPVPSRLSSTSTITDSTIAGTPVDTISVLVTDDRGVPVRGADVDFAVTAGGGQVPAARVQSDAQGVARIVWTAGPADAINTLRASLATAPAVAVTFSTRGVLLDPMVTAGATHTCALTARGQAFCWGGDASGAVGDGTAGPDHTSPTPVTGGLTFWSLSAGVFHTCGVALDLRAYCWGEGTDGRLGNGSGAPTGVARPTPVAGNTRFVEVAAGGRHTCARTGGGETWCWGSNQLGALGAPVSLGALSPQRVEGAPAFVRLAAGTSHTCGLTSGGTAYCWGYNAQGQLGDGTLQSRHTPMPVQGVQFLTLSAGGAVTCGMSVQRVTYCWGDDSQEQLGNGVGVTQCGSGSGCSSIPVEVQPRFAFMPLSAGRFHSCGLAASGSAFCWGANYNGELGNREVTDWSPTGVVVEHEYIYVSIAAGELHTCGITSNSRVMCWGANTNGQLGDGTTTPRRVPTRVAGAGIL